MSLDLLWSQVILKMLREMTQTTFLSQNRQKLQQTLRKEPTLHDKCQSDVNLTTSSLENTIVIFPQDRIGNVNLFVMKWVVVICNSPSYGWLRLRLSLSQL